MEIPSKPFYASSITGIKRFAKRLKRDNGITHHQALDLSAQASGYSDYRHALKTLGKPDEDKK